MRPLNNLERTTEVTKKTQNLNLFEWEFKKLKWQMQNKIITQLREPKLKLKVEWLENYLSLLIKKMFFN
jgi:hypothetical protein